MTPEDKFRLEWILDLLRMCYLKLPKRIFYRKISSNVFSAITELEIALEKERENEKS